MKVFVCSIAKNEEQFVKRWADSCKGADGIFMLDTGSTDNTVELARSLGVTVYEQSFNPWRFDVARNHLLDLLPEEDAWLIWLDLDEILTGDWLTGLSNVPEEHNRVRYNYIWSWNADGSPGKSYAGDKIVRRFSHRWKHPVHEVNVSVTGEESQFYSPSFEIYHHPDHSKSRSQYLGLLLLAVDEDPEDDRNTYYCARELFFNGLTEAAIDMFKRHLDMPTSNWMPERAWSMRYLAKLMPEMREVWLLRAVAEYDSRETWLDLSHHYYKCGNWLGSLFAAVSCLKHEVRPNFYLNEPEAWSYLPWDLAAIAAYNLQMFDHAVSYGIKALELEPSNDRLKQNLFFYQKGGNFAVGHDIL